MIAQHTLDSCRSQAAMREGARLFSSFSFCERYVLKAFQRQESSFHLTGTYHSKNRGRLQSVGWHESSCHGYYIIHGLAAVFQLCRAQLTCLHSPSTMMGSRRQPKNGKQTHWVAKETSKTFYGCLHSGISGKSCTVNLS